MAELERFITDLREGRYTEAMIGISEIKADFLYTLGRLGEDIGTTFYGALRTAIYHAEDGKLQKLIQFKGAASSEYEKLMKEIQKQEELRRKREKEKEREKQKQLQQQKGGKGVEEEEEEEEEEDQSVAAVIKRHELEIANLRKRLAKKGGDEVNSHTMPSTDPNMAITPDTIAVMFSAFYDNEFFDAYQELLKSNMEEDEIIKYLNKILKFAYDFALTSSEVQLSWIMICLTDPREGVIRIPDAIKDDLKEHALRVQRESARFPLYTLYTEFLAKNKKFKSEELTTYALKCVEICWYCSVQNPKMYLKWEKSGVNIRKHLKPYSKSGIVIDYQVWPTLYLHMDGPVLTKGIVQMR